MVEVEGYKGISSGKHKPHTIKTTTAGIVGDLAPIKGAQVEGSVELAMDPSGWRGTLVQRPPINT
jgi:hypothetical protein